MYRWKITYEGSGPTPHVSYHFNVQSMAVALSAYARNAKADKFTVEKLNDDVRERPSGTGDDSGSKGGTEAGSKGEQPASKKKR